MSTTKKMFTNSDYQGLSLVNVRSVNSYDNLAAITAATVTYALGVDDHDFRAYAKDTKKFYKWTGTALEEVPETSERITVLDNTLLSLQDVVDLGVDLRKNTLYKNEAGMIVDVTSEGTATLISDGTESGRIVFKPIKFVADTEVIFNLNADATIDFQSGKAKAGSIQEVENKFLMATGIAVHYKDGGAYYLDSSSRIRVIDETSFGITLGVSAEMVVSLNVNLVTSVTKLTVTNEVLTSSIEVIDATFGVNSFDPITDVSTGITKSVIKAGVVLSTEDLTLTLNGVVGTIAGATLLNDGNTIVGTVTDLTGGNWQLDFLAVDFTKDVKITIS